MLMFGQTRDPYISDQIFSRLNLGKSSTSEDYLSPSTENMRVVFRRHAFCSFLFDEVFVRQQMFLVT